MIRMEILAGIAALVGVGAITPGPNNLAVMSAAARFGIRGALPAIAGIVAGSLALFLLVALGAGALLDAQPRLRILIVLSGCAYLGYLGVRLFGNAWWGRNDTVSGQSREPRVEALGLFGFQFLNPKGWALVFTVSSAAHAEAVRWLDLLTVAALFVAIPTVCLLLWSLFGSLFTARLRRKAFRIGFDSAMGSVLVASALLLGLEGSVQ
jgi:threonine/homoserine/homoserine lactone efflux protein